MIKYLREYRFYIILFFFLLIPILSIDTQNRAPRDYKLHDRVIVAITSPIQIAIHWTLDQVTIFFHNYIYLTQTKQDNLTLLEENRKLLNTISSLRETQQENERLRKVLNFKESFKLDSVVARIIARDVSTEFRAIRINRGARSGIRENMAVVTHEGVVGRILRTTADTAEVVTMMDLLSAIDSIDERSRARGVIEGFTEELAQMRFIQRTDDIQVGDILITSGLGGIFPKGIPIGSVANVNKKKYGISQQVHVRPSVDFTKLEEVIIITKITNEPTITEPTPVDKP